jgi:hypothetical protein
VKLYFYELQCEMHKLFVLVLVVIVVGIIVVVVAVVEQIIN